MSTYEFLKDLKYELKMDQKASENRLEAAQKALKDDLQAAQKALKDDLQAAQKALRDELKMERKASQKRLDNQLIRFSAFLTLLIICYFNCILWLSRGRRTFWFQIEIYPRCWEHRQRTP